MKNLIYLGLYLKKYWYFSDLYESEYCQSAQQQLKGQGKCLDRVGHLLLRSWSAS